MKSIGTIPKIVLGLAFLLAVVAAVRMTACDGRPSRGQVRQPAVVQEPGEALEGLEIGTPPPGEMAPIRRQAVVLYYPSAEAEGLVGELHEIFETTTPGDRVKQIVADLISGPSSDKAISALPSGTRLRQVFVLDDGTAYLDFSRELRDGIRGGSSEELLTVYSIVDSVALNVAEVRRVGILIAGGPVDSLNGHLDLRRPLPADPSLIVEEFEFTIAAARRPAPTG